MSNLVDIQSQIEKLQKQANEIKTREFDKTVQDIVAKMRAYGITVKDLSAVDSRRKPKAPAGAKRVAAKPAKGPAVTVPAKYRGPSGETWSGRGLTPRWLATQINEGRTKEDFAIKT